MFPRPVIRPLIHQGQPPLAGENTLPGADSAAPAGLAPAEILLQFIAGADPAAIDAALRREIGRASCRERV